MKPAFLRPTAFFLFLLMPLQPLLATCGGGGGGGRGGISPSGGANAEQAYAVPWKFLKADSEIPKEGLIIYWFPASQQELEQSSLRISRQLSLVSTQCVALEVADKTSIPGQKFLADAAVPLVVIATPDHQIVAKVENKKGKLDVQDVEKMVEEELRSRQKNADQLLSQAKEKAKSGDNAGAITLLKSVYEQKCLFPKKAKDAAKELKRLGEEVADVPVFPTPHFDAPTSAKVQALMTKGLAAEIKSDYPAARDAYLAAHKADPADPTPLRYLGETYRHHLGQWDLARTTFEKILAMPSDPMSRAVALHGIGKMTIHDGDFKKGLHLMEASVNEYPLALAYRNLAVYWNSEGDQKKAREYTDLALKLDPKDSFNLIFAAAFSAGTGEVEASLRVAKANESDLSASYNLAAIYAQAGQRDKALSLLKRHFYEYERYAAVREKEMMEARVDAVFASIRDDKEFLHLTRDADGRLPMVMSPKAAEQMQGMPGKK
jgi:tetratricopeptide (TPR) repeat protein